MCGRFALVSSSQIIRSQFNLSYASEITPCFNIAPGSQVLCVVLVGDELQPVMLRWGLIPAWASDRKKVGSLINARAETVFEKPAFRQAIKSKGCFMPMSGFYEWHQDGFVKQPYYFRKKNQELLAVAALWDTWQKANEVIHSCCLITTEANKLMHPVHHRMPVILDEEGQGAWLSPTTGNEELIQFMKPYPHQDLEAFRVTPLMNKASFDHPLAIESLKS